MSIINELIEKRMAEINEEFRKDNLEIEEKAVKMLAELKEKGTIRYEAPYDMGVDKQKEDKKSYCVLTLEILNGENAGRKFASAALTNEDRIQDIQNQLDKEKIGIKISPLKA